MNNLLQSSAMLIEQCSEIIKKFEEFYTQTGFKYNIFKIAQINEKEVIICRIIADLLDPKGNHKRGDVFLQYFLEIVNEKNKYSFSVNTKNSRVYTEYSTDINRRIDIVIEDGKTFIPIEVKIYAKEQESQVSHYAEFSRIKNGNINVPVLYLTIEGDEPTTANTNNYICLSFKHDIVKWLNKCLKNNEIEKILPIREVLKQLIGSIKSICGISEDEKMENAVATLVTQSEDYVKAAIAIKQALETLGERARKLFKTKIMEQVRNKFPEACWEEDDKMKFYGICFKIQNGGFGLSINYDWRTMEIWSEDLKHGGKIKSLQKKMSELTNVTGVTDGLWEYSIWRSDTVPYSRFVNVDDDLYFYKLYKEYLENTSQVVNLIINIVNELNAL
jgi:hypothetical protein